MDKDLYIDNPHIRLQNDTIRISQMMEDGSKIHPRTKEADKSLTLPIALLKSIHAFGLCYITPPCLQRMLKEHIAVSYYDDRGRFLGRLEGAINGNVLLRREQYRIADDSERSLAIAKCFIEGKIHNSRVFMKKSSSEFDDTLFKSALKNVPYVEDSKTLMGYEGNVARLYFNEFPKVISSDRFKTASRTKRPPRDAFNALLSFGYGMLNNDCASALQGCGLDPYVGFLHQDRPGRMSLASDLIEEFRCPIVDRAAVKALNNRVLTETDFVFEPSGAVQLTEKGRKAFVKLYSEQKDSEIKYPLLQEIRSWKHIIALQARLLSRVVRGDVERYTPMKIK